MILNCPTCNTRFAVDEKAIGEGRDVKCGACAHVWFVDPNPLGADFADFMPMSPKQTPDEEANDLIATFEEAYEGKKPAEKDEVPEADLADTDFEETSFEQDEDEGEGDALVPEFEEMDGAADTMPNFAMPTVSEEAVPAPVGLKIAFAACAAAMLLAALLAFNIHVPGIAGMLGQQDTSGVKLADVQVREIPSRDKARYVVEGKIVNMGEESRAIPTLRIALLDGEGNVMMSREYNADKTLEPGEDTPFTASKLDTAFKDRLSHILVELGSGAQLMIRN